jgi:hypothetical protein
MRTISEIILLCSAAFFILQCSKKQPVEPQGSSDLMAVEVIGPPVAEINQEDTWQIRIENAGSNTENQYSVKLFKEEDVELGSIDGTTPIAPREDLSVAFIWTPTTLEETHLYGRIVCAGDENVENDASPMLSVRIHPEGERQYLIWDNDDGSGDERSEQGLRSALRDNGIRFQISGMGPGLASTSIWPDASGTEFDVEDETANPFLNQICCEVSRELPAVLCNYDIVFVALGTYCLT